MKITIFWCDLTDISAKKEALLLLSGELSGAAESRIFISTSASLLAELSVSSPQKILFLLCKKIFSGSKYPKNILFHFEKGSTDLHPLRKHRPAGSVAVSAEILLRSARKIICFYYQKMYL